MKCHAGVEFPSGKPCPKCGAKLGEVCWPGINNDLCELNKLRQRLQMIHEITQDPDVPCWQKIENIAATAAILHEGRQDG